VVFLSTPIDLGTKIRATKPAVLLGLAWNCESLSSVALDIAENFSEDEDQYQKWFPNLSFSLRFLCVLCVSAVELAGNLFTAELPCS